VRLQSTGASTLPATQLTCDAGVWGPGFPQVTGSLMVYFLTHMLLYLRWFDTRVRSLCVNHLSSGPARYKWESPALTGDRSPQLWMGLLPPHLGHGQHHDAHPRMQSLFV